MPEPRKKCMSAYWKPMIAISYLEGFSDFKRFSTSIKRLSVPHYSVRVLVHRYL